MIFGTLLLAVDANTALIYCDTNTICHSPLRTFVPIILQRRPPMARGNSALRHSPQGVLVAVIKLNHHWFHAFHDKKFYKAGKHFRLTIDSFG